MRTEYLYEFAVLARLLSFTAAARELHISQPALSGHIASLERELGLTLVDRSRQRICLTPAGQACLADINAVLGDLDNLERHVRDLRRAHPIHVTLQMYQGHRYTDDIVSTTRQNLAERYPLAEVEIANNLGGDILAPLLEGTTDVALLLDTFDELPSELVAEPLVEDPLVALVPRANKLAAVAGSTLSLADLASVELLVPDLPDNHWMSHAVRSCFEAAGLHARIVERYFNSIQELYQGNVNLGDAVAIDSLHASYSLPMTAAGKVSVFAIADCGHAFHDVAVYRRDTHNEGVRLLVEELKRVIEGLVTPSPTA